MALVATSGDCSTHDKSKISRYRRSLFSSLLEHEDTHKRKGGTPSFEVVDKAGLRLRWDLAEQRKMKRRRLELRAIATDWLDTLTDRQYELASGVAMMRLGATKVYVTPHGNEFGIDFLARVPAYSKSSTFISDEKGIRIIGQSKNFSSRVVRDKIQSFNDCVNSVRNNRAEMLSIIPAWFRGGNSPIIGCFVARSGFQGGARTMGLQAGHLLFDTLDLAEILASPRSVPLTYDRVQVQRQLWSEAEALELT